MGRKCSVFGCKTGYDSQKKTEKIPVYGFPKDCEERQKWVSSIPNQLSVSNVTDNMGVCALHWPADVTLIRVRGRYHTPSVPPSIFQNVPKSCIPTASFSSPRSTSKSSSSARAPDIDEMAQFKDMDRFKKSTFFDMLLPRLSNSGYVAHDKENNKFILMSFTREGPVPNFSIYFTLVLTEDGDIKGLQFEAYQKLTAVKHSLFPKGTVHCWSQLDELLRFINAPTSDTMSKKWQFLYRQLHILNTPKNARLYALDDLTLAFSWYAKSRALYSGIRDYIQLPSISTLRKITRMAKNVEDETLFKSFFCSQEQRSKGCIIIIDEIYIKASITYRGGSIFGYAEDQPGKMANTLLCIMVKCFFGSKKFLAKLLPCHALTAQFQYDCVQQIISSLEKCGARVTAIINDNNRVNQAFFKLFHSKGSTTSTPWLTKSTSDPSRSLFLLYDPVHLMKNIRNNWITEKTKTLQFPATTGEEKYAKWSDLVELYNQETETLVKLSKLTKSSVQPSNLEKQKVSLALNVFCDETSAALKSSSKSTDSWKNTALFIDEVLKFWKLVNCKTPVLDIRLRDASRIAIDTTEKGDRGLQTLLDWANFAEKMKGSTGVRKHSLTRDTGDAIAWTCRCFVDLCRYLLTVDSADRHSYVCLGFFQQDDLEQHFGHFRMASGCNFYVTAQEVFGTHAIDRAKMILSLSTEIDHTSSSHQCHLCDLELTEHELLLIDDLQETVQKISSDEKMSLFYIGGYVASKHAELAGSISEVSDEEVVAFLCSLNRGGLTYPSKVFFRFVMLAYAFFTNSEERLCRNRFVKIMSNWTTFFHLEICVNNVALRRIANIFMKRYAEKLKGTDDKEEQKHRKIAKLSSTSLKSA